MIKIIKAYQDNDEVTMELEDGRVVKLRHDQECCESVHLESYSRHISEVIGEELIGIDSEEKGIEVGCDHRTETTITIETSGGIVTQLWVGESNGYYGEGVDLEVNDPNSKQDKSWMLSESMPWKTQKEQG